MKIFRWLSRYELLVLGVAAPLLLFPLGGLPWVGLVLIGLTWLSRRLSRGRWTVPTGTEIPALVLAGMALVGYWISVEPELSRARFWNILLDLAVFYALANGLRPARQLRWVAGGLVAVTAGVGLLSLLGTDWDSVRFIDIPWLYERLPSLIRGLPGSGIAMGDSDLINPRWVGITMGVLAPVLLAAAFAARERWLRALAACGAIFAAGLVLLTQTLQGMVGLAAGVIFLLAWRWRGWLLLLPVGLLLAVGCYLLDPAQVSGVLLAQDNPIGIAVVLRLDIWSRALAMIRDMPFTGIGLNTFPPMQWHFYPGYLLGPEPHAHNLFLQTALDLGLPGLAAFLWFFIAWGVRLWRNSKRSAGRNYNLLLAGVAAGAVAYLAHGLIDALMLGAKPGMIVWGLLGVAAADPGQPASAQQVPLPRRAHRLLRLLPVLLFIGGILAGAVLKPESLVMNLAAIQAHWGLYPAQVGEEPGQAHLELAQGWLLQVQAVDPDRLSAYELLGRVESWQGNPAEAMQALAYRVAVDGKQVMPRYYPPLHWLRQIEGIEQEESDGEWKDLLDIYQHWANRFPERAYTYVEIGLVWQCYLDDPVQAARVVQVGIEKEAMPSGLLEYYQSYLEQRLQNSRENTALCMQP